MEKKIEEILEAESGEISILHLLDGEERRKIAGFFELRRFPAGAVCTREGEPMDFIGIIAAGSLEVKKRTDLKGKYIPLAVLDRGSHIGEFSMLPGRPAFGTVTALEETELLVISRERLDAFMDQDPRAGVKVLKGIAAVLAIRLQNAIDKVARLS